MRKNTSCALILAFAACPLFGQVTQFKSFWAPITDAERNLTSPVVDKSAGVEALFWRVHVIDQASGSDLLRALHHYVRLKVFNEKGKQQVNTIDISFGANTSIMFISGRTIKPDGTIVELTKDSIHERDLIRAPRRIRQKVKSFAMPGVEPGSIVEYRWTEVRDHPRLLYMRLQFQREFPVQKVSYHIKPLSQDYTAFRMAVRPFNCRPSPLKLDPDGYNVTTLENIPAFQEEQMMPPVPDVRPWVLVYYHDDGKREPDKYWADVGKERYRELKESLKLNNELRAAAAAAVQGVPESDRVVALVRYMRKNFRNLFDHSVTDVERAKILKQMPKERWRTSVEVFKSGIGTSDELNTLFAAFASEIGLDARPALVANRSDLLFHPSLAERYFLDSIDMAVKTGETWKLYDVSTRNLPANMISWQEEGVFALLTDPKKPVFIQVPSSAPEASLSERTARFALDADGGMEGDVVESFTGHTASERRSDNEGESEGRQQERIKEQITALYPQAEVSVIQVVNADDSEKPIQLRYHVKIPGYAQRTGKRIFFQPLFFQRGAAPLFSSGDRKFDINFRYAWKEADQVTIALPEGFELDHAESPGGMSFGDTGSYSVVMGVSKKRELVSTRVLIFGAGGALFFPQTIYPKMKNVFDEVNRQDSKGLSLKQTAAVAAQ
jgi:hypothetical protein